MSAAETLKVCAESDLEVGEARAFNLVSEDGTELRIAVVRGEECWFAIDDECSHADYSLAEGDVDLDECTLECWKHGSQFSLTTGKPETLPATRAVQVYDVHVASGEVAVALPQAGANNE